MFSSILGAFRDVIGTVCGHKSGFIVCQVTGYYQIGVVRTAEKLLQGCSMLHQ